MANVWRSEHLVYRGVEEEDEAFLGVMSADSEAWTNAAPMLAVPMSKKVVRGGREYLQTKCFMAAIVCLPAPASPIAATGTSLPPGETSTKPIPIGSISLSGEPDQAHHRNAMLGINIIRDYQSQGYGSEAIQWALRWGFRFANLHKIWLGAFEWNPRAVQLYERLGFVRESVRREHFWFDGRYWDLIELGMLEHEWRERYLKKGGEEKDAVMGARR